MNATVLLRLLANIILQRAGFFAASPHAKNFPCVSGTLLNRTILTCQPNEPNVINKRYIYHFTILTANT